MRSLPTNVVFDRSEARALGWTDSALTRAIHSGRIVRLRRGQLMTPSATSASQGSYAAQESESLLHAIAAARAMRDSVISHHSAALLHGLPMLGSTGSPPALTVNPRHAYGTVGTHMHRATLPDDDVVWIDEAPVTSVARTVIDLARSSSTSAAVVAIDAALNRRATTMAELDAVLLRCHNWPGIKRAVRAVKSSDRRSESPLESVSRLVFSWLHLPAPTLQAEICDASGRFVGRVDFYWDEFGVIGEADGAAKYTLSPTSLHDEKLRQETMENLGAVVVRWGWDDTGRAEVLRTRINTGFERGRARDRSGFHRGWSVRVPATGHTT